MKRCLSLVVVLMLACGFEAHASIYMRVSGIMGESDAQAYKDWIDVADYALAFTHTSSGAGGGGGSGQSTLTRFDVSADASKASPRILLSTLTGQHHVELILAITKQIAGQEKEFARWTFEDILFTAFKQSAVGVPNTMPRDIYTINPAELTYKYTEYGADGAQIGMVQVAFNLKTGAVPVVAQTGEAPNFTFALGTLPVPEPATATGAMAAFAALAAVRGQQRRRGA
jgi:type VI protein secretion system component Hcp